MQEELSALIIDTPHIDNILSGEKTWEMRTRHEKRRGPIGLIRKRHPGKIIGVAEMIDSLGKFSKEELLLHHSKHLMTPERLNEPDASKYKYAWVLKNAKLLTQPILFEQKSGPVIWVTLDTKTSAALMREMI
jgi:hypothetical protein